MSIRLLQIKLFFLNFEFKLVFYTNLIYQKNFYLFQIFKICIIRSELLKPVPGAPITHHTIVERRINVSSYYITQSQYN